MVFLEIKMIFFFFNSAVAALVKNNQFKSISQTHLSWVQLTKITYFCHRSREESFQRKPFYDSKSH